MNTTIRFLYTGVVLALGTAGVASFAATQEDVEAFADYTPAATVIKCPHIGEDVVEVPFCGGMRATCVGTEGDDLIIGTENNDVIVAGGGNDVVHADAGDDVVCGGFGNDSLFGARGDDIMYGEEGDDWLFGAKGQDSLDGGLGDYDVLWGGPGIDTLDGGEGISDICMLQREMGVISGGCETQYPPPGYVHEEEPELGVLKLGKAGS